MAHPELPFFKMNGIGNSILVVDARAPGAIVTPAMAREAARLPGLGFDQLMAISPARHEGNEAFVTIFNADGTESDACGNGTRCVVWALLRDTARASLVIETGGGSLACERVAPLRFTVDMGAPVLDWPRIPLAAAVTDTRDVELAPDAGLPSEYRHCGAVSMGNPHAVFFVADAATVDIERIGPLVEHHPMFPERTNVSFAQVLDPTSIRLRVWERSAGATLACGSAACATAVAAIRRGFVERRVRVALPGGDLELEWRAEDNHVVMTGDVALEHAGTLPADLAA